MAGLRISSKSLLLLVLSILVNGGQVGATICDLNSGLKTAANLATLEIPSGVGGGVVRLLISHLWPDNCDPSLQFKNIVRDAINESEERDLERTFNGIKNALEDMTDRGDINEGTLRSFYDNSINR